MRSLKIACTIAAVSMLFACQESTPKEDWANRPVSYDMVQYQALFESCLEKSPASKNVVKQCARYAHNLSYDLKRERRLESNSNVRSVP